MLKERTVVIPQTDFLPLLEIPYHILVGAILKMDEAVAKGHTYMWVKSDSCFAGIYYETSDWEHLRYGPALSDFVARTICHRSGDLHLYDPSSIWNDWPATRKLLNDTYDLGL